MSSTKTRLELVKDTRLSNLAAGRSGLYTRGPLVTEYRIITFQVIDAYDEWELEETLEALVARGAKYFKPLDGESEIRLLPEEDPRPFVEALELADQCVADVKLQEECKTIVNVRPLP